MLLAGDTLPPIFYPSQSADEWLERDDINIRLDTSNGAQVRLKMLYTCAVFASLMSTPLIFAFYNYIISLIFSFPRTHQGTLPLVVASFSLNGTFLGLTDVDNEIVLCGERPSRLQSAWRVGILYQIQVFNVHVPKFLNKLLILYYLQCTISVTELAAQFSAPVFYDLCILS